MTKAAPTLAQCMETYLANKSLADNTRRQYRQLVKRCLNDWLDQPITEINNRMCLERHKELSDISSARAASNGRGQANYVFRTLRAILNYSIIYWDLEYRNPVAKFGTVGAWAKLTDRETHVPADRLAEWYRALQNLPSVDRDFFLVMAMTGCRRKELGGLLWSELDFVNRLMRIPKSRTKNHLPHIVPLSPQVMHILLERQKLACGSLFVFSTPDAPMGGYGDSRRTYERVERAIGVDCNPHALRRTFARIAKHSCGFSRETIKRCLNHSSNDITDRYIGKDPESLRICFDTVAEFITSKIENRKPYYRLPGHMVKLG